MPVPTHGHGASGFGSLIIVTGGYTDEGAGSSTWIFDPVGDIWTAKAAMPTPRGFHGQVTIGDYVYAIAGRVPVERGPVERYDPVLDVWTKLDALPGWRNRFGMTAIGNSIFIVGGENNPSSLLIAEIPD